MSKLYRVGNGDAIILHANITLPPNSTVDIPLQNGASYLVAVAVGGNYGLWYVIRKTNSLGTTVVDITKTNAFNATGSSAGVSVVSTAAYQALVGVTELSRS